MFRKGLMIAAMAMAFAFPAVSKADVDPVINPWELTLGGGASNSNDFDGFQGNLNGSLGYYFTEVLELSVRQSIVYTDLVPGGSNLSGATRAAVDFHFPMGDRGQIVPFVGANIGFIYGDATNDTWVAGPEAGVKFYVDADVFVFLLAEYQFFFEDADEADDAFDDGAFVYSVGIGFRF